MSVPHRSKPTVFALLFGWPAAALLGLGIARATRTNWPAGVLPAGWLVVLMVALRRYAKRSGP